MTAVFPDLAETCSDRFASPVPLLRAAFPSHRPPFSQPEIYPRPTPIRPLTYILFGPSDQVSGRGGGAPVAAAEGIPERRRRVKMVAWSSPWLIVLGAPASEVWHGRLDSPVLAGVLLATFVGLYLILLWLQFDRDRNGAVKLALLAPLTGISVATSLAYHQSWIYLFFFLSVAVACSLPPHRAVFGVAAVTVLDAVVATRPAPLHHNVGPQIVGVFMAGLVVLFINRMLRLIADLNEAREELARLAVANERLRFARDLHDLLGHTLSLIVVKSEAVRRLVHTDAEAAARESGDIELVSRQALAEVREAVTNYRERSLESELEGARLALLAAGIEATINQPSERLPDTVETVLGWTVREGVTNVVRHSNGRHCAIDLRRRDGIAVLEIWDDGHSEADATGAALATAASLGASGGAASALSGAAASASGAGAASASLGSGSGSGAAVGIAGPRVAEDDSVGADRGVRTGGLGGSRAGTGLRGLAERLAAAHGRLEAGRRPDGGFRLAVTVPLQPDRPDA